MSNRNDMTDEELATALQQQYRLEFLQRQAAKQQGLSERPPASAPSAEVEVDNDEAYARHLQQQLDREASSAAPTLFSSAPTRLQNVGFENNTSRPNSSDSDARYAQQLQDEELARSRFAPPPSRPSQNHYESRDEEMARHLADEEMARRLTALEHQEAEARRRSNGNRMSRWCRRIIPLITIAIAITVPLLFVFGVFKKEDVPFLDNFGTDWIDSDPWSDQGTVSIDNQGNSDITVTPNAVRWNVRNGGGLTLDILNAMEDRYDEMLATAVKNWDAGAPIDSLTLRLKKISYDLSCREEDGVLKACSGDYGATKWRGLNEVKLNSRTKIIVSSTARMNNYYLNGESDEQRLYTICHELGHGFGLPHWDTDFYNKDLGNCMDYTVNPENNMKPSESNFEYLAVLYGGRNVTETLASSNIFDGDESIQEEDNKGGKDKNKNKKGGRRRKLTVLHKSDNEEVHYIEDPKSDFVILRQYRLN